MRSLLASILIALALAPGAAAAVPNPCSLLTNAEVAKMIGSKIANRTSGGNGRFRVCTWAGPPLGTFTSVHAQLFVQVTPETKAQFTKSANAMQGAVRVRGVGDMAYADTGAAKFLRAWQKGYALLIQVSRTADDMQAEKVAAKAVFAHL